MSEGTPGRGPAADSRTEATGETTNGRPPAQPVRYGPRNGSQRSSTNGSSNGRTVSGPSTPQQYRAPQPPRAPANGGSNGSTPSGANGSGSNGSAQTTPNGTNGSTPDGRGGATPASYTRPRTAPATTGPEPSEQDRVVADARTAAAARNASAAKVSGGSALSGGRPTPPAPAEETAVIPAAAGAGGTEVPTEPGSTAVAPAAPAEADRNRSFFGRRRGGRDRSAARADATTGTSAAADTVPAASPAAGEPEAKVAEAGTTPTGETTSDSDQTDGQAGATTETPLTWRDRLGLAPKEPKPQPVVVPDAGPGVPTAAAAAAVAASVAAGTAPPETKASPTGPTTAPQPELLRGRVTPSSPVPATTSDTVVIPAVEAGTVAPAAPAAAATTQPLVSARPKVGSARRTRKARLRLSRVDPWSVMKTALLFSIAAGIILVVATYGVWSVLNASGLFAAVDDMVKSVVSTPGDTTPFRIEEYVNTQKIIGVAALIAVVDVLIFTALATLGSFLYNLAATVLGGLEVTLAED